MEYFSNGTDNRFDIGHTGKCNCIVGQHCAIHSDGKRLYQYRCYLVNFSGDYLRFGTPHRAIGDFDAECNRYSYKSGGHH